MSCLLTAEKKEKSDVCDNLHPSVILPKLGEEPWDFGSGHKLPPPYPNVDVYKLDVLYERDFPWTPPKSQPMELRSGKKYYRSFTGTYCLTKEHTLRGTIIKHDRIRGTQRYSNGAQFEGRYNINGAPYEGTFTFPNGNTLTGLFTGMVYTPIYMNTIRVGTFYNKHQGISYTGRWIYSTTGDTQLLGYILVNFNPLSKIWKADECQVFYYRDGRFYKNFDEWVIDRTNRYGFAGYDLEPFPTCPMHREPTLGWFTHLYI